MSAIAQGSVDSTFAIAVDLEPSGTATVLYWIAAGRRYGEVRDLDGRVREETPARLLSRTASYGYTWVNKNGNDAAQLPEDLVDLYRRSLLMRSAWTCCGGPNRRRFHLSSFRSR
jgi:GH15 family glucan-1,4-alpha-glucosidase